MSINNHTRENQREQDEHRRTSIDHEDPSIVAFSENKNTKSDSVGEKTSEDKRNSDSPNKGLF